MLHLWDAWYLWTVGGHTLTPSSLMMAVAGPAGANTKLSAC